MSLHGSIKVDLLTLLKIQVSVIHNQLTSNIVDERGDLPITRLDIKENDDKRKQR